MNTKELIIEQCKKYPQMKPMDIFKFLYQSTFGCGHMVESVQTAVELIKKEAAEMQSLADALTENLDGCFCRVHLSYLSKGMSAETLGKLFYLSSLKETEGKNALDERLKDVCELASEEKLPFSATEFENELKKWKKAGCPAIHHSEAFRKNYNPAYRVIHKDFVPFLPLFARVDSMLKNGKVRLAIEGGSASGKSTIGKLFEELYHCTVFHMDDFFLRPEQRTAERFAEIGGNVDRERFLSEVLEPLVNGDPVYYRRFDCSSQSILPPEKTVPEKLTVTEGAYSMHPDLEKYYNLSVFLDITPSYQKERILKRNSPDFAKRFFEEWIPMEKRYFEETQTRNRCDIVILIE